LDILIKKKYDIINNIMAFNFEFSENTLSGIVPSVWYGELSEALLSHGMVSKLEVAAFISQVSIESGYFSRLSEDLNYSASGLLSVFPTHFNSEQASNYAHKPELIANRVYANRYGNGSEASGDGYKYSGKGLIQVTFRDNYESYSQWAYKNQSVVDNPELLTQAKDALLSAIWFWTSHKLGVLAAKADMVSITKVINGGTNDLQSRVDLYNKIISLL
jgi:putative chitinase